MLERYVAPSNKVIDLMAALQMPVRNIEPGEQVMIVTDTSMDPLIQQAVMAVVAERGAEPTLMMYQPREHHTAEPPAVVAAAQAASDVTVYLTTTALAHSEFFHSRRSSVLLMEEATVEILTSSGCRLTQEDCDAILAREHRVREYWMRGGEVHVTTPAGTDLWALLEPGPKRSGTPFGLFERRDGQRPGGTWPWGECRTTPLEGSGRGTIVWDICAHAPDGRFSQPVVVTVEDGRAVAFDGGAEAAEVVRYLELHGDENSYAAPAEISVGINHRSQILGLVRNDKKALGTAHVAVGRSDIGGTVMSKTHFDGLMANPTITVDGDVLIENGRFEFDEQAIASPPN